MNIFENFKRLENVRVHENTAIKDNVMCLGIYPSHTIFVNKHADYNLHENIIHILKECGVKDERNIWIDKPNLLACDIMLPVNKSMIVNTEENGKLFNILSSLREYRVMFDDFETKILYVPMPKETQDMDIDIDQALLESLDCILVLGYQMEDTSELNGGK